MLKSIIKPPLFCYSTTVQTISAGGSVTPTIDMSGDSDFVITEIRASVYKAAAINGDLLMQLSLASGELFSNVGVDVFSFASTNLGNSSGYPIRVPDVKVPSNTNLDVQLTNNNAESLDVQIQFWGIKVNRGNPGPVPC